MLGFGRGGGTVLEPVKNQEIHIENNTFQNSGVEAVGLHVIGSSQNQNTLTGNTFINNQWHPLYFFCGVNGNEACSGGQVFINHASQLLVERNIIKNGSETVGLGTGGIEIDTSDNVEIRNNDIHDNTGAGIIIEPGQTAGQNLVIENNRIFNNQNGNINVPGAGLNNNCFTAGCPLNLPTGFLSAVPNPCLLHSGNTTCISNISWTIAGAQNISVTADNVLFEANNTSYSKNAPWIPAEGRTFKLYDGSTILDTLFVRGLTNNSITSIPGDINDDGKVDIFDYNILLSDFGKTGAVGFSPADLNPDGKIDIFDYNILVGNFGK